jgi:Flp pilus assembly protein TadD
MDEALGEYRAAVRLNPTMPDAHYGIALILKQQGRLAEAITEYRQALRLRPEWPPVRRELEAVLAAVQR